jgi:hypothetical protein
MKKTVYITLLSIFIFSCKHDLEKPTWEVDMITPIAHSEMSISDLINQNETIVDQQIGSDSLVSLVYSADLLQTNYDNLLDIQSTTNEKMFRIDSVKFDDVVIEHNITIGSIITELGVLGPILYPDGQDRDIPAMPGVVQNDTIDIDASEYFETMTLYNGKMNLEITNGFPTDISNMSFMLYNSISLNLIATFNIPLIESGATYTESVSVAGETLDQIMLGIINNMDIEASGGLVPINYTDAISTTVSITEIQIMEATAYFPNQLLHEEIVEQSFNLGTTKLTEIGIKEGYISIIATSSLPDTISILYFIPSLTKDGVPFEELVKIPPNINTTPTSLYFNCDGYIMDLKGQVGRIGGDTVNTIYSEMHIYLDSTGELETINRVDSFNLYNEFNIVPEYAKGYIGQDTLLLSPETKNTSIFESITNGTIDLKEGNLNLSIKNYVGADASISFQQFSSDNTNDNHPPTSVTTDQNGANIIGNPYFIERATLNNENIIIPTLININLDASDMLEILPNQTTVAATFMLNPNGEQAVEDFLYIDYPISATLDASIPLSFIANNLTISKTIEIDLSSDTELEIDELYISIENGIPLSAKVDVILLDQHNNTLDTLVRNTNIICANTDTENRVTTASNNLITITNTEFNNVRNMKIVASFTTSSITEHIDIYSYYTMKVNLSARFKQIIGE